MFLWEKYFTRIFYTLFMPFIAYMTIFTVYVTFVFEKRHHEKINNNHNEQLFVEYWVNASDAIPFNGTFYEGAPIYYGTEFYWRNV